MDRFERVRALREEYESALDEAGGRRDAYHREVTKLYRSGVSLREIADALGLSHQRVHQIVGVEAGPPRSRRRAAGIVGAALVVALASGVGYVMFAGSSGPSVEPSPSATHDSSAARTEFVWMRGSRGASTFRFPEASTLEMAAAYAALVRYGPGTVAAVDPRTGRVLAVVDALDRTARLADLLSLVDRPNT